MRELYRTKASLGFTKNSLRCTLACRAVTLLKESWGDMHGTNNGYAQCGTDEGADTLNSSGPFGRKCRTET